MSSWPGNAKKERTTFGRLFRGELMARVRSIANETTEGRLASLLRRNKISGWRRHLRLPGKPDFAWPEARLAVFVDGCFWHGHNCGRNVTPKTNAQAWREKMLRNKARDRRANRRLRKLGWKVIRIWECQLSANCAPCVLKIRRAVSQHY